MAARLLSITALIASALACQAPFDRDRHDLVGDRIVALQVAADGDADVRADAWLLAEGRTWSDAPAQLRWYWLNPDAPDLDALDPLDPADAIGPHAALVHPDPGRDAVLGLLVRFPDGTAGRATYTLDAGAPDAFARRLTVDVALVGDLQIDATTPEQLARDARADTSTKPTAPASEVPEGRWARLTARFDDADATAPPAAVTRVRWMGTGGTFLELDRVSTDWAPADIVFDDLEVDSLTPLSAGAVTMVALALDDAGTTLPQAVDVWVGPAPGPGLWVDGRWLPTSVDVSASTSSLWQGELAADDTSPTGLRLDNPRPVALDALFPADPFGTQGLPCDGDVDGPFDPSWLFRALCRRDAVVGATVVVAP